MENILVSRLGLRMMRREVSAFLKSMVVQVWLEPRQLKQILKPKVLLLKKLLLLILKRREPQQVRAQQLLRSHLMMKRLKSKRRNVRNVKLKKRLKRGLALRVLTREIILTCTFGLKLRLKSSGFCSISEDLRIALMQLQLLA